MTQLTDLLKQHDMRQIADVCRRDPQFTVFNLLWEDQEQIIPACEKMGWQTLDDLAAWLNRVNQAVGNITAFVDLIDPAIQMTFSKSVSFSVIHKKLFDLGLLAQIDFQIHQNDAMYFLPTKAQWEELASKCPVRFRTYKQEAFDCDDFTKATLGWYHLKVGNVAAGFIGTRHYRQTSLQGGHAMIAVMDANQDIWIIEPQNGKLYAPKDSVKLGGNIFADRMEIARCYF